MSEGKNVIIDYYNGIYFIREKKVDRIFLDYIGINRFVVLEVILKCF